MSQSQEASHSASSSLPFDPNALDNISGSDALDLLSAELDRISQLPGYYDQLTENDIEYFSPFLSHLPESQRIRRR